MSNYPDGMTSRHWEYLDGNPDMGDEHHDDCPHNEGFQGINNANECYCGNVIGEDDCECDCTCELREMTADDIAIEGAGL